MEYLIGLIFAALSAGTWVLIYLKRRNRKIEIPEHDQIIEGTDREREHAESELRKLPANIREHFATTHELVERFSTRHGYTSYYVEEIANQLRQGGCSCETIFQPGAIAGVADSLLEQQGHYELWVANADVSAAREILRNSAIRPQQ